MQRSQPQYYRLFPTRSYAILVVLHGISWRHRKFLPHYHPNREKLFSKKPISEVLKSFHVFLEYVK